MSHKKAWETKASQLLSPAYSALFQNKKHRSLEKGMCGFLMTDLVEAETYML